MTDQDDLQSLPFFVIEMVLSINTYIFILYIYCIFEIFSAKDCEKYRS